MSTENYEGPLRIGFGRLMMTIMVMIVLVIALLMMMMRRRSTNSQMVFDVFLKL